MVSGVPVGTKRSSTRVQTLERLVFCSVCSAMWIKNMENIRGKREPQANLRPRTIITSPRRTRVTAFRQAPTVCGGENNLQPAREEFHYR